MARPVTLAIKPVAHPAPSHPPQFLSSFHGLDISPADQRRIRYLCSDAFSGLFDPPSDAVCYHGGPSVGEEDRGVWHVSSPIGSRNMSVLPQLDGFAVPPM
jgi:hypothetical protein